jgi:hypothetical protein
VVTVKEEWGRNRFHPHGNVRAVFHTVDSEKPCSGEVS